MTTQIKLKIAALSLLFLIVFTGLGTATVAWCWNSYMNIYRAIDISALSKEPPRSTVFYDSNGDVITELTNSRMEYMPLDQFPKTVQEAVIAVEDARFREHQGIDFNGIARAFYHNWKSGETVQGGSTITQQLAKTLLFSPEQTYSRKINEAVASIKIENEYSKDQILELYLNYIYFGEGAWGLQRAAESYFGKQAMDLTLSESALLAAIPKSPTNYSPVKKPEQAKERRNLVLSLMAEQGRITEAERDSARNEEIKLAIRTEPKVAKHPSFVDHVINEAIDKYGLTEQQILSSGYHIYTTMAPTVQNAAEEVYKDASFFPEDAGGLQSGIVLMQPQTGAVLGIVGSRNLKQEFREFNYATQNERQPGSAIKPILVYAPALSEGYGPKDKIFDAETDFGGSYTPMNYMRQLHGWVTLEDALIQSYNIPAVALLKEIGIDNGLAFASKAGLRLQPEDRTLGIALGGMSRGTSPLAMAQAYTMFANQGNMAKAYAITKIVDRKGQLVGSETVPVLEPLLDPSAAFTMTRMLEEVVNDGTGQSAQMDRPVAGKTGTTQLPDIPEFKDENGNQIDGTKDAWFVGYTPELVAAVWLGYEKTNKDHYLTTTGGRYPAALFKEVVSRALQDVPVSDFEEPESYAYVRGGSKRINGEQEAILLAAAAAEKAARDKEQAQKQALIAKAEADKAAALAVKTPSGKDKPADTKKDNNGKPTTAPSNADKNKAPTTASTTKKDTDNKDNTKNDKAAPAKDQKTAAVSKDSNDKNKTKNEAVNSNSSKDNKDNKNNNESPKKAK
ncbi:transglycosylase domain-containing protein [Paenibacillus periandrae]|uniref:transglycosylase domain-containing protein n=1 Tax=Paenibacillus periandrae TaxID=1761741 RepID=UPI001F08F533|nr:PBP1A family penicillin-binding protein [Paenibacillus periandrae]